MPEHSPNLELSNNSTNTTTRPTNLQMIVIRPKPPKTITTAIQSSSSYKDLWATYIKQRSDSLTRIYMASKAHQHVPQEGIPNRPFLFVNYILHSLTLSLYTCKTIMLQIPRFISTQSPCLLTKRRKPPFSPPQVFSILPPYYLKHVLRLIIISVFNEITRFQPV